MSKRAIPSLTLRAPDPRQHHDAMFDLIAKVFSHSGYYNFLDILRQSYLDHSHYDWRASRIGLLGERLVSHYGVWDYLTRIGAARLRTGGIGVVATDGTLRKLGLMRRTAQSCIEAMTAQGYDLSILFGIDNFYHRFGYIRAWSEQTYYVRTNDLPAQKPAVTLRRFRSLPLPALDPLFNRQHRTTTGTAVRPTYARFHPQKTRGGWMWLDRQRKPEGYVAMSDQGSHIDVNEAVGDTDTVLAVIGKIARKLGADEVRFHALPYTSALAQRLRLGTGRLETRYQACGGPMVRILNLRACLTKMAEELSTRLRASPLRSYRGTLMLNEGRETVTLDLRAGKVRVMEQKSAGSRGRNAIFAGDALAQLLLGTDEPGRIVTDRGVRLRGDAAALLPVLFPAQYPMLHMADRY